MKTLIAVAAASLLALAAPALAQTTNANRHHHLHGRYRVSARTHPEYGSGDVYVRESRPTEPVVTVPAFAWRPQAEQEGVGADLIGPGSSMDNPTDQHDVSR